MKYNKVRFTITDNQGHNLTDETLTRTAIDIICAMAADAGFDSFEEDDNGLTGYAPKDCLDLDTLDQNLGFFPIEDVKITYNVEDAEDKNWNETWEEEGFEPIYIDDKIVIRDAIHPRPEGISDSATDIVIDAKQAFGTGNHETTRMIVSELASMDLAGKRVLDCGCGTGILSITAAKMGATSVTGYDIDEWSVRNTEHNCLLNGVNNVETLLGDARVLANIEAKYDVVLANINRNILLEDMPEFRKRMAKGATLILSGFYKQDNDMLTSRASELGLTLTAHQEANDWSMLVFSLDTDER